MKNRIIIRILSVIALLALMTTNHSVLAAPEPEVGSANGISNGGEWSIYGSKYWQIKNLGDEIDAADSAGTLEVTSTARSAVLQFDLATKTNNQAAANKVIKSAKLVLTPMVSKDKAVHMLYEINNSSTTKDDLNKKVYVSEYTVPRVSRDDFWHADAGVSALTTEGVTSGGIYPEALSKWQTAVDITGNVITENNKLSLYAEYKSTTGTKTELATTNIASNGRLNSSAVKLLYDNGVTDYSKWVYPQIVFNYTDQINYQNAHEDFVAASAILLAGTTVGDSTSIDLPAASNGSNVVLEMLNTTNQPAKIVGNSIVFNEDYTGNDSYAYVKLTVSNQSDTSAETATYTRNFSVPIGYVRANTVTFSTAKNYKGVVSVTSSGTTYTDGTAYAKVGNKFTVNDGANTGYKSKIIVTSTTTGEVVAQNDDGTFTMPESNVSVDVLYTKPPFGTARVAGTNSASVQSNNNVAGGSGNFTIAAGRIAFVKFDLSDFDKRYITAAKLSLATDVFINRTTRAVFYVPNNNWTESGGLSSNFQIDPENPDTKLGAFKYTQTVDGEEVSGTANLFSDFKLIAPDVTDDNKNTNTTVLSSAKDGILGKYFLGSCDDPLLLIHDLSADKLRDHLAQQDDNTITLMIYSPRSTGYDINSVVSATNLEKRPSLTISESADLIDDDDLLTQISTIEDLTTFAKHVSGGNDYIGRLVKLNNDIDLSSIYNAGGESWTPIGTHGKDGGTAAFAGTFDGQNHTISGLYIKEKGIAQGLFGAVSGTVKDLTVSGDIDGSSVIGGIAGWCSGYIINCNSSVNITAEREAGGIVGTLSNNGRILNCENHGDVQVKDKETYAGGVAAMNVGGFINNSFNTGDITNGLNGFRNKIGGVVGYLSDGEIVNSYNTGTVRSDAEYSTYLADETKNYVGGVVAYSRQGIITSCYNTGAVYNEVDYAGGVAGYLHSNDTVTKSYNTGAVTGKGYVGGIVGSSESTIEDCYNTGAVEGGNYVGGIVGYMSAGMAKNCYSTGTVQTGGMIGFNGIGSMSNSYYLAGSNTGGAGSTSLTAEQFKESANFVDWDFQNTWTIGDNAPELNEPVENITELSVKFLEGTNAYISIPNTNPYVVVFAAYDDDNKLLGVDLHNVQYNQPTQMPLMPIGVTVKDAKTLKVSIWQDSEEIEPLVISQEKAFE